MNNEIKSYVNSFIPQTLPKTKQKELYDELMCHLLDKSDRYEEISYSKEDSMKKAIDDFGTDETVKNAVSAEFENLYHEKTWWAFIPFAVILLMNILCMPLGTWIYSADYYEDPNPIKAFISFAMVFVCLAFIFFARAKCYKKMLVGTAAANLLITASVLMLFYPQAAMFTIENNIIYLLDKYTPIVISKEASDPMWYSYAVFAFLILSALYCLIAALLIKKGYAHKTSGHRKKAIVLGVCYSAAAVISCILLPKAEDFTRNYPTWFDYVIYSSEESESLYDSIDLYSSYGDAANMLKAEGWAEISDYENSLDKNTRKKFRAEYNELNYGDEYKVWFRPEEEKYLRNGNNFVFLKADSSGTVISKCLGDLHPLEPGRYGFRIPFGNRSDDIQKVIADFKELKKGDKEIVVLERFGKDNGRIFSHFESITDNEYTERFAILSYYESEDIDIFYCLTELTFTNARLKDGRMISFESVDWTRNEFIIE